MKQILYVGRFGLPNTAPGLRVYELAKIFRSIGFDVSVLSNMVVADTHPEKEAWDGFSYQYVNRLKPIPVLRQIQSMVELRFAGKTLRALKKRCEKEKPEAIILYNDLYALTKKLIPYCREHGIKLVADVTEWYEKRKYRKLGDKWIPYYTDKRIRRLDQHLDGVIAISHYLYDYYRALGCHTFFIPPVFEISEMPEPPGDMLPSLIYAGSPGSKDILNPVFTALEEINQDKVQIKMDVIGVTDAYIQKTWKNIPLERIGIFTHGRLSHEETVAYVRNADFGVLLREDKRYAKAGYSTKFSECMSCATAMICNRVGGADRDIVDGENGFLLEECTGAALSGVFHKIVCMDRSRIETMKKNAYAFALRTYQAAEYREKLAAFMDFQEKS